jgi:hypothetical protein
LHLCMKVVAEGAEGLVFGCTSTCCVEANKRQGTSMHCLTGVHKGFTLAN